jgi:hypothetical protein
MNNYLKYLFVTFLLFNGIATAQDDTIHSNTIDINNDEPEWYFTDTLIDQLLKSRVYENWTKIVLVDQVYPNYLTTITFEPKNGKVRITDTIGMTVASISKKKIDKLLLDLYQEINQSDSIYIQAYWPDDPLNQYELDSIWYKENVLSIWDKYRNSYSIVLDSSQLKNSQSLLLDYNSMYRTLKTPNNWNPNQQIMVDVKIAYPFDTLHIQATSYFVYALPWYYFNNQTRLSNSNISQLIGRFLKITKQKSDNLDRLLGTNFEMLLMDDIYNRYLKKKINVH